MRKIYFHLPIFLALMLVLFASNAAAQAPEDEITLELPSAVANELRAERLESMEENLVETGVQRDDIPPINFPQYISTEDASLFLEDDDVVFIDEFQGEVRIYPQLIMVWHSVVNVVYGDEIRAITYSPLTGSVIGYHSRIGGHNTRFGDTGLLLNNNTVLYDRATNSLWPQLFGVSILGALKGREAKMFSLLWTRWKMAVEKYPYAKVLSTNTGYRRSYGKDPYGTYRRNTSYYHDDMIVYPLIYFDKRLKPKEVVLGVKSEELRVAIVKRAVRENMVVNFEVGVTPFVAMYDPTLDTVRVFSRRAKGRRLHFEATQYRIFDKESKSEWSFEGVGIAGPLYNVQLAPVEAFEAMWLGWSSFYPSSQIEPESYAR